MSETHTKEPAVFVSDEEFLEGFHRTRKGLHAFDGVDLDDLTRRGVEAYWQAQELSEPSVIDTTEAEHATAMLARRYAPRVGMSKSRIASAIGLSTLVVLSLKWRKNLWRFLVRSWRRVPAALVK